MTDQRHAETISQALWALNIAITYAVADGLNVDLDVHEYDVLSGKPRPQANAAVSREIVVNKTL
jgi:aryl-phospho-beta-D-glucosidase BglC (GH1 family)